MIAIIKKIPSVILFLLLTIVYVTCGYILGYHQGYKSGQSDYIIYINNVLENVENNVAEKPVENISP